jgi:hypothetical protein
MQIGRVRLAGIECHDDPVAPGINRHIPHTIHFHERLAQLAHALVAILSLRRNFDLLKNGKIGPLGEERACRIRIIRSRWVHARVFALRAVSGCGQKSIGSSVLGRTRTPTPNTGPRTHHELTRSKRRRFGVRRYFAAFVPPSCQTGRGTVAVQRNTELLPRFYRAAGAVPVFD